MKRLSAYVLTFYVILSQGAVYAQRGLMTVEENKFFHDEITRGIKIFPGQWRPNFSSEQIVWISPPWPSARPEYGQEFIYLDFPEAIKVGKTMVYLSHVHPRFPALYNYGLAPVTWSAENNKLSYERKLPNGVSFDGTVTVKDSTYIELRIGITNNSGSDLDSILLQTCAFLNAIQEFNTRDDSNKFVYVNGTGWTSLATARTIRGEPGKYYVGWLGGSRNVELPFIVVRSSSRERYVVFSWLGNSYSFIGNVNHPCFHSDPWFPDLKNRERKEIKGLLFFHDGDLESLTAELRKRFTF